jgi:predicted lipoprotein with Yx(FWY)xxD motif
MRALSRIFGLVLAMSVVFVGFGATADAAAVTVGTRSTSLGVVLVGPTGMTLYTYSADTGTTSNCTGGCAAAWPPLTVSSGEQALAGPGVTGRLGTITRGDGSTQVTYNSRPLYYWQGDQNPGDVTGNGVGGFSVARPGGVTKPATTITASLRAGTTRSGPFISGRTLVLKSGAPATLRFRLGTAFKGRSVSILVATRGSNGRWSTYRTVTTRRVESSGYAYYFVKVKGWMAFKAKYAGDTGHGAGTSNSVVAHGR